MASSQLHEDFSREEHVKAGSDRGFGQKEKIKNKKKKRKKEEKEKTG